MALRHPPRALTSPCSLPPALPRPDLSRQRPPPTHLHSRGPWPPTHVALQTRLLSHLQLKVPHGALLAFSAAPPTADLQGRVSGQPPDQSEGRRPGERKDPLSCMPPKTHSLSPHLRLRRCGEKPSPSLKSPRPSIVRCLAKSWALESERAAPSRVTGTLLFLPAPSSSQSWGSSPTVSASQHFLCLSPLLPVHPKLETHSDSELAPWKQKNH